MNIYENIYSPKHDLAQTKNLNELIARIEVTLAVLKVYKKNKIKYTNLDHVHQFTTTDPKLAKRHRFRKMNPEEFE